ncbi:MAG: hypothetical protein DWP97_03155 [Calditrichaeota bacterium]|nr:MAG: hypothetical protein DWP97_03155 [Calditrichota bacterium]
MSIKIYSSWVIYYIGIILCCLSTLVFAKESIRTNDNYSAADTSIQIPECSYVHEFGKLIVQEGFAVSIGGSNIYNKKSCITNKLIPNRTEYPKGSNVGYMAIATISIGGIIGNDTLVSNWSNNEFYFTNETKSLSTIDGQVNYSEDAVSECDIISTVDDNYFGSNSVQQISDYYRRNHKPLNVKITNKSYSWSYGYSEDIILHDIKIENFGNSKIEKMYIGIKFSPEVGITTDRIIKDDDIGGYKETLVIPFLCNMIDTFNLVWGADNDGDPIDGEFKRKIVFKPDGIYRSAPDVTGFILLDKHQTTFEVKVNYNWLAYEYNPMLKNNYRELGRDHFGGPLGDKNRYFLLSNNEIDFDPIYTSRITQFDPSWLYPNQEIALDVSDGYGEIKHYLSIGPYDLSPGATVSIPFAYVAGEDFHTDPNNINNLPNNPQTFYNNLDFSDIAKNALWARWIYDNPGVDTDGDGDSGRAVMCNGERIWVEGDGVPDWKAAGPPPAPYFWLTQEENAIHVRFNGSRSETEKDIFTKIADFEGYNIYFGRDDRETSLSLVGSYDLVNYDKYVWHPELGDNGKYIVEDIPYSLDSLKCLYANSCDDSLFNPLKYTATIPILTSDSIFYFTKHHFNSELSAVSKVYPNARDPRLIPEDSLTDDDFTEEGFYKFFEYEFTIDNLLPTVEYWVNVTAFDFGSPKSGLQALETSKTVGIQEAYPLSHEEVGDTKREIFVYPNPYRIDAGYRANSFEGIGEEDRHVDRVRKINFANLPPKCEIKIFSLDGDLVRHLSHDVPESDPTHTHHEWDLITRNTQLVVSGLYYWTVEFPNGETQIGKFVIIM